ncbi:MAG: hypothetical protein FJZ58_07480 [Chlamydiae bacterium]|nr:hypothetical protein [Chlamydiota bacterium]
MKIPYVFSQILEESPREGNTLFAIASGNEDSIEVISRISLVKIFVILLCVFYIHLIVSGLKSIYFTHKKEFCDFFAEKARFLSA